MFHFRELKGNSDFFFPVYTTSIQKLNEPFINPVRDELVHY